MKFLIQTINKKIVHDFSFTLLETIRYNNWINNTNSYEYELSDKIKEIGGVPVGSVEFVCEYLSKYHNKIPIPINVPQCLFSYANRKIINGTEKDIFKNLFVKSNDKIKSFTKITDNAPPGNYQISELIKIDSEYRCFVFRNKLVGMQNYSGNFTIFPNISIIEKMINDYKNECPVSYTLDVGINKNGTFVIEVHDFFSCGLYGFSEHKIYSQMLSNWFYEFLNKK